MEARENLKHCIDVAMGKKPADILFVNGKVISTFTEEVIPTEMAVANGKVVALGHVKEAREVVDLKGSYLCPSLIDAHIHIESSMLSPEGFAEAVVPHGTGTVISDPHEIVNVFGLAGLEYMVKASENLPLSILYGIPSCVPATHMETTGGSLSASDIKKAYAINPQAPALSELMNYPGVFLGIEEVLDKVCVARELGLAIDGHSPMLSGKELNAYLNARILTDHECSTKEEAIEKLRRGMYVLMREGSAARNLKDLVPILTNSTAHRVCIASDDRHPDQLLEKGHLDHSLRELIKLGVDPLRAIRILSLNPAIAYHLDDRGGLGIGYRADFFILDSLEKPMVRQVYHNGVLVADKGELRTPIPRKDTQKVCSSVHLPKNLSQLLGKYPKKGMVRVIGLIEGQLVTEHLQARAEDVKNSDIAYLAVVERYNKKGQVGLGFVKGLGLTKGALASTVAHDHHNLILAGKNQEDMVVAANVIEEMGGGFVLVCNKKVQASVSLPIGGIMSPQSAREVAQSLSKLEKAVKEIGISIHAPFMVLSFLALSVIPHLKLTDMGLVDVDKFALVPLVVE